MNSFSLFTVSGYKWTASTGFRYHVELMGTKWCVFVHHPTELAASKLGCADFEDGFESQMDAAEWCVAHSLRIAPDAVTQVSP